MLQRPLATCGNGSKGSRLRCLIPKLEGANEETQTGMPSIRASFQLTALQHSVLVLGLVAVRFMPGFATAGMKPDMLVTWPGDLHIIRGLLSCLARSRGSETSGFLHGIVDDFRERRSRRQMSDLPASARRFHRNSE
jgi:hypothetical protein